MQFVILGKIIKQKYLHNYCQIIFGRNSWCTVLFKWQHLTYWENEHIFTVYDNILIHKCKNGQIIELEKVILCGLLCAFLLQIDVVIVKNSVSMVKIS